MSYSLLVSRFLVQINQPRCHCKLLGYSKTETTPTHFSDQSHVDHKSVYKIMKFYRPSLTDLVSCTTISPYHRTLDQTHSFVHEVAQEKPRKDGMWMEMQDEARVDAEHEPVLSSFYYSSILSHSSMESALASVLSVKLSNSCLPMNELFDVFLDVFMEDQGIIRATENDLRAVKERDPACLSYLQCFLNFKGFLACQAHRVAHKLWSQDRKALALLIQNRVSEVFAADIHPAVKIGSGISLDHATGLVIGETAVIGDNVSILHNVTLGGTGKESGDRHPKIGDGVLIGAGTNVLGNVMIGDGAKIGAGSVVLKEVPPRTTAVGNPCRLVGEQGNPIKLDCVPALTMDHTSHMSEWSDYVI